MAGPMPTTASVSATASLTCGELLSLAHGLAPAVLDLYRQLHAQPELSGQEAATAARLAAELRAAGLMVQQGVGGHGLVAILANGPGPVVALRADMDALPIAEATGLPYASQVRALLPDGRETGVMHACGHDVHCACLVGVARLLVSQRQRWSGTLLCYGQPAEEMVSGARAMLADGLYTRFPAPDAVLGLHVEPELAAGHLGYTPGEAMAGVTDLDITVRGQGGHGAYPHLTLDPVVLAAQIVLALQTAVSRAVDPLRPAVLTIGAIHGGTKHNIIPDTVQLKLTVRYYHEATRLALLEAVARICRGCGLAAGLPEELLPVVRELDDACPWLVNDTGLATVAAEIFGGLVGPERVGLLPPQTGSEDFAWYGRTPPQPPTFFFWLGSASADSLHDPGAPPRRLHTATFAPDAATALPVGMAALAGLALRLLAPRE